MAAYIEFDKTSKKIRRVITADEAPVPVAYLSYQEIPEGLEIDLDAGFDEIMKAIADYHNPAFVSAPIEVEEKPQKFVEV